MTRPMPTASSPDVPALLAGRQRILVTGGAGYNCCAEAEGYGWVVVRRLLAESEAPVFNLDKCGYVSDLTSIEHLLAELSPRALDAAGQARHTLLRVDLSDAEATAEAVQMADPDLVLHLAAESHLDRSIENPRAYGSPNSPDCVYIESHESGMFNLLQTVRAHWEQPD
jgi:dTDP-glucose 4,6-dehydratase